jgi:HD-GYP domain-containing protein (c-di-GMP phosphodiesterase class II)
VVVSRFTEGVCAIITLPISDQAYRRALTFFHAREEIRRCSGAQFDPKVVEAFFSLPESLWVYLRKNLGLSIWAFASKQ